LSASAVGFYGDRGDEWLTEESKPGVGFLAETCIAWEREAAKAEAERIVSLRIGVVLGRHGGAMEKMLPLFKRSLGGKLGSGSQWMSWIHVDDLVQLILFSFQKEDLRGAVNAVAPEPVQNSEFTRVLAESLGVSAHCAAPAFALKLALGEMSALVLSSQRVSSKRVEAAGFKFRYAKLEEAFGSFLCQASKMRGTLCHEFLAEQWFPRPLEELFQFFSEAKNLEEITPPWLHFKITAQSTPRIQEGTTFDYQLRIHGLPVHWRSLILDWKENQMFSDTQQKGPYHLWYHTHSFERLGNGTLMRDKVIYRLPGAYLGDLVAHWKVASDIEKIFRYRRESVSQRFWP
jgi:ligand-binding SRPBCC domain-containing protein